MNKSEAICLLLGSCLLCACGGSGDSDSSDAPDDYNFQSRFVEGESSVSYSGQVYRHMLILELTNYIDGLADLADTSAPTEEQVRDALNFYIDFDASLVSDYSFDMAGTMDLKQDNFDALSGPKSLREKLAGHDTATDYKSWGTPGTLQGWKDEIDGGLTPDTLLADWIDEVAILTADRGIGEIKTDPFGNSIADPYVSSNGLDYKQLIQKFLLAAVAFQQGADDYLDDVTPEKGLLASHQQVEDKAYSSLEHAWDEGFGYFGAARNYLDYSDEELAGKGGRDTYQGFNDTNGDGLIDLNAEFNFGHSLNCAKRDLGSSVEDPTDMSSEAMAALIAGRHLIASIDSALSDAQLEELRSYRDNAVLAWEQCIAATVVHYINDVIADSEAIGTEGYSYSNHAKHWSEMKGFALSFQFNPNSPMLADFEALHDLLDDKPEFGVDEGTSLSQYLADLRAAKELLGDSYGFSEANLSAW